MPRKTSPKYRYHKARDCAVVTIGGRDHYLGAFDSDESHQKYHRLVAEHLAAPHHPATPPTADAPLTMTELMAAYWRFAKEFYVKEGEPTSEVHAIKLALKFVRRLYADTPALDFSPKKLKAVREAMIRHDIVRTLKKRDPATGEVVRVKKVLHHGMSRKCINKLVARVKRMYAWGHRRIANRRGSVILLGHFNPVEREQDTRRPLAAGPAVGVGPRFPRP